VLWRHLAILPSCHQAIKLSPDSEQDSIMAAPQLSVRSERARELAHALSKSEGRPIHAVVEEALMAYAAARGQMSFKDYLDRMKTLGRSLDAKEPHFMDKVREEIPLERDLEL
jgi:hypothetical protein